MTDSKRQRLEEIKNDRMDYRDDLGFEKIFPEKIDWLITELDAALEREAMLVEAIKRGKQVCDDSQFIISTLKAQIDKLVEALGDSCLCGEFEYIATKCPACIALEAHKKAKG